MRDPLTFFGKALQVAGTWYVRQEVGGGVLLPISAERDVIAILTDQQAYKFEGKVEADHRDCAVSARVKHAIASGSDIKHRA